MEGNIVVHHNGMEITISNHPRGVGIALGDHGPMFNDVPILDLLARDEIPEGCTVMTKPVVEAKTDCLPDRGTLRAMWERNEAI